MYKHFLKRCIDLVISIIGLIVLIPVFLFISVVSLTKFGRPILFSQKRIGINGKEFKMYKFRSMNNKTDEHGNLLPDDVRLTPYGQKLRNTSVDELPELINIIKGDMSIVGPRPLLPSYIDLYTPEQNKRHLVKPGLTGLAQINGRNAISWEEKFKYDVIYAENVSFKNDLLIFFKTIGKVLKREGISSGNEATMPVFTGTKKEGRND